MRIIYWIGRVGDKLGSLERYNILLAEICNKRGHEIVIMHDKPNSVPEYAFRLQRGQAQFVVIGNTYDDPWHALPIAAGYVRSWKPNIVHTHFVNPLALPMLKLLRVPLIYQTYHSGIDHKIAYMTRLIRFMVQLCTKRVLAVSNRVRCDEIRAGIYANHIQVIPLGISIRDFLSSADKSSEPIPPGYHDHTKKIIITVGRFFPEKGMRYSVEAAVEVVKQRSDVIWWLVGKDGPEKDYALSLVHQSGLTDRIFFLGQRNDVPFLLQRAYIQVVGSLYEGSPLMALESSALGVPTVGTQIGGLDEVVLDRVTGILVPRCSGSDLAKATLRLLDDKSLRDQLGFKAREHLNNKYNAEKLVNDLVDMYEKDFNKLKGRR
jgi:glycosyltransferase involved in cell wall biosynthesis